jgi:hypothetical protein
MEVWEMKVKKSTPWTFIVALLFAGALFVPLVGFPNQTLIEVWGNFNNYGYEPIEGDYLTLALDGPDEATLSSSEVEYTFTIDNVNPDGASATGIELIVTANSSIRWLTEGTPCEAIPTDAATAEAIEGDEEPGEILSTMWTLLETMKDREGTTATSSTSGSTVLYCQLGTIESGNADVLTLGAVPAEVGMQTIIGLVICEEPEEYLKNNTAAIQTEVTPNMVLLPLIIH